MSGIVNKGDKDNEVYITFEDQQQINRFARHNALLSDVNEEIKAKKQELANYSDAVDEIMMLDDEDVVPYQIGESFFASSTEKATELLEKQKKVIEEEVQQLIKKQGETEQVLKDLKVTLYAKFGNNINLENDDE